MYMICNIIYTPVLQSGLAIMTCPRGPNSEPMVMVFPHLRCFSTEWWNLFPYAISIAILMGMGFLVATWAVVR